MLSRVRAVQNRFAAWVGLSQELRAQTVEELLHRPASEARGYWLQLAISMGIATFGLVLGSTAVVIGAMLVSPLMGPILELGLGLATGSPLLVLRSAGRTGGSVVMVIAAAAAIAALIPFEDVNAEIRARTTPNVLDLLIAVLCALAAVYTTTRRGSSDATAAAGTAIGISLVPPLCVSGYGIGIADLEVAVGALLLFTANFSAIMLVSTFSFLLLGYDIVRVGELEQAVLARRGGRDTVAMALVRALQGAFASRVGPVLRLAMPVVMLAAVYVPLSRALSEVSWEIRVRTQVQQVVASLPSSVVESRLVVERHTVALQLVLVGDPEQVAQIREDVDDRIRLIAGVPPTLETVVLPDMESLRRLQASLRLTQTQTQSHVAARPPLASELSTLASSWPASAGPLLGVTFTTRGGTVVARAVHLGDEVGPAALELLASALAQALGASVSIEETALPAGPVEALPGEEMAWLVRVAGLLSAIRGIDAAHACVTEPEAQPAPTPVEGDVEPVEDAATLERARHDAEARAALHDLLDGRADVTLAAGRTYSIRLTSDPCQPAEVTPAQAQPVEAAPVEAVPVEAVPVEVVPAPDGPPAERTSEPAGPG
jgi:uncharacterized hydrophobic protein (TIGR00271 family)